MPFAVRVVVANPPLRGSKHLFRFAVRPDDGVAVLIPKNVLLLINATHVASVNAKANGLLLCVGKYAADRRQLISGDGLGVAGCFQHSVIPLCPDRSFY